MRRTQEGVSCFLRPDTPRPVAVLAFSAQTRENASHARLRARGIFSHLQGRTLYHPHTPETVKAHPEAQAEIEALKRELAVAQALAEERGRLLDQTVKLLTDQRHSAPWWKRLLRR